MALAAGDRIGPYVVERAIEGGRGGFAQVVLARRTEGRGELVAVKVQRTAGRADTGSSVFATSLSNEVEMLRRVRHPGIVRIVPLPLDPQRPIYMARDINLPGQPWYFAMEYLAGGALASLVEEQGPLEPALAAELAAQVCDALAYLHANGMAHLDVKPRNIMLRAELQGGVLPQVVLGDFGIAQHQEVESALDGGSLEYVAPERLLLLEGQTAPDSPAHRAAADVYALGATLYYLLTGRPPFTARSAPRLMEAVRSHQPVPPLAYNKALAVGSHRLLNDLVLAMLDKTPELRPTPAQVLEQLDRAAPPPRVWSGQQAEAAARPEQSSQTHVRRRGWRVALIALLVLAVGGATAWAASTEQGLGGVWGAVSRTWQGLTSAAALQPATPMPPTSTPAPAGGIVVAAGALPTPATTATPNTRISRPMPATTATPNTRISKPMPAQTATPNTRISKPMPSFTLALTAASAPTASSGEFTLISPADIDGRVTAMPLELAWAYSGTLAAGEEFDVSFCYGVCGYFTQSTKANRLLVTPDSGAMGVPTGWRVAVTRGEGAARQSLAIGPRWPLLYVAAEDPGREAIVTLSLPAEGEIVRSASIDCAWQNSRELLPDEFYGVYLKSADRLRGRFTATRDYVATFTPLDEQSAEYTWCVEIRRKLPVAPKAESEVLQEQVCNTFRWDLTPPTATPLPAPPTPRPQPTLAPPQPTATPEPPPAPAEVGPNGLSPDQPGLEATMRETEFLLRWSHPAGLKAGEHYHVVYQREDGGNRQVFDLTERRIKVGFGMPDFGRYDWTVEVVDASGTVVARSDVWHFWVAP